MLKIEIVDGVLAQVCLLDLQAVHVLGVHVEFTALPNLGLCSSIHDSLFNIF
jgi:hypothetical protein